jgi:hypothetical protein
MGTIDGALRDTDWYEVCISEVTDLTWCVSSDLPAAIFILSGVCPPTLLAQGTTAQGCIQTCITLAGAAPGQYRFFVAPANFTAYPCPTNYRATLTASNPDACVPCPCTDGFCCKGDTDGSGDLTGLDCQGLVNALLGPAECGSAAFCTADVDDNGFLENADIAAFVAALLAKTPCPVFPDNCVDRLDIFDGVTAYDSTGATTDGPVEAGCQFDGQTYNDLWFNYVATCDGALTVSTCEPTVCLGQSGSASYDTDIVVYDGCDCNNLVRLGCNDDGPGCPGFHSLVVVPVVAGNCYKIRVGGWQDGDQGPGNLLVCCGDAPPNPCDDPDAGDCCVAHAGVGCNIPACCNAICANDPFCCDTQWDGLCASAAQGNPLCNCGAPAACNPDAGDCCVAHGTPGCNIPACCQAICANDPFCCNTQWDGICANAAIANPDCNCGGGGPPANDACANRIGLTQGVSVAGTTIGATLDGTASCGAAGTSPDVWYTVTTTPGASVVLSTCAGTTLDTVLSAHDGCGGAELVCLDDFCGLQTQITVTVPASGIVIIRVAGFAGGVGNFTIVWL